MRISPRVHALTWNMEVSKDAFSIKPPSRNVSMEMYRCKTQRIVNEFLGDEIALDECTAALAKASLMSLEGLGKNTTLLFAF